MVIDERKIQRDIINAHVLCDSDIWSRLFSHNHDSIYLTVFIGIHSESFTCQMSY